MVGQKKFRISKAIIYLLLTLLAFICLYPVLYVLSMSFSNEEHLILRDVYFFPKGFTFDSYALLFETNEIWRAYLNTIIYTVLGTLVGMTATLTFVPSYARDKDIAIDFLLYMATDEAQITYMDATGGATLPFSYDVKKENPEFYNQLSEMQKERLDYFYNENYDISVLLSPDSFPLVKFGGVREFTRRDYHTALSLNMSGWNSEDVVTAQKIYDDTKSYWTDNGAQRWTTAVNQAGI